MWISLHKFWWHTWKIYFRGRVRMVNWWRTRIKMCWNIIYGWPVTLHASPFFLSHTRWVESDKHWWCTANFMKKWEQSCNTWLVGLVGFSSKFCNGLLGQFINFADSYGESRPWSCYGSKMQGSNWWRNTAPRFVHRIYVRTGSS